MQSLPGTNKCQLLKSMETWSQAQAWECEHSYQLNCVVLLQLAELCYLVSHTAFLGDILGSMTSSSLGRHLQGCSRPSPQLFAKGGKGLSQEVSPCWLQNPKWFIACLSGSYFKSQWFIESNAYILYNEVVLQYCQHKQGTCCLFLLPSDPSKPTGATFQLHWGREAHCKRQFMLFAH